METKTFAFSYRSCAVVAAAFLAVAGCATTTPPAPAQLALANAAVNDAQSAGAGEYAALELRAAQNKLSWANAAQVNNNAVQATRLAEAAEVDARLAEAKARNAKAQQIAGTLQSNLQTLQQEIERSSSSTGGSR